MNSTSLLKSITLLYVEDEPNIREVFSKGLTRRVKELYTAENGLEGYEMYMEKKPDIILTDIKMPKMSGIEMIKKIREVDQDIPIHITTAHNESVFFLESIENRVNGYHIKPVNKTELFEKMQESAKIVLFEKEREHHEILMQKMFDLQKSIIIISDGRKMKMANRAMYRFFGYSSLEDFMGVHTCICEKFIEDEKYFHLGKVSDSENWIEILETIPKRERLVSMFNHVNIPHSFTVSINNFDGDDYIVTFTDISDTMVKQFQLEKRVSHDSLTGAYSRDFFYNEIDGYISESVENDISLGVIIFDIDFFKSVNDKYGHSIGDAVLIKLVSTVKSSIRTNDLLIRWGGEEFILIVMIESAEALKKIAEHIRSIIENTGFKEVEHITCSFGLTIHKANQDIYETISQADEALYKAKETGRNKVEFL